jgi:ubiquinone/menaquinone biosynthesis C-methylase UbiE
MSGGVRAEATLQSDYYSATAAQYDDKHVRAGDEHCIALEYVAALARAARARSILDVGAGTGRAVRLLSEINPDLRVVGIEPSSGLRKVAAQADIPVLAGSGYEIPFADDSFDFAIATGVMHHVREPSRVVTEMMRVARSGVLISDSNRFGQGPIAVRVLKQGVHAIGLWPLFQLIKTRGNVYMYSEGDGVFYSYSIFDSQSQLRDWADRTFVIPTKSDRVASSPRLAMSHGLLAALREPKAAWAGRPEAEFPASFSSVRQQLG